MFYGTLDSLKTLMEGSRYVTHLIDQCSPYILDTNRHKFEPGKTNRVDIIENKLYILYFDGNGKGPDNAELEAHKKFTDLQYVVEGCDLIGVKLIEQCKNISKQYDEKTDIMFYKDKSGLYIPVNKGELLLLTPEDAHAPLSGTDHMRKIIVKMRL